MERVPGGDDERVHLAGRELLRERREAGRAGVADRASAARAVATVVPTFPSASFIAAARAWTAGGWRAPGGDERAAAGARRGPSPPPAAAFARSPSRRRAERRERGEAVARGELRRHGAREPEHLGRAHPEAVVGHAAGDVKRASAT